MTHKSPTDQSVLITNIRLKDFAGSEINCLTLAKTFRAMGYNVEVATLVYDYPIRENFEKENIPVTVIPNEKLPRQHYDIMWLHHAILANHILFTEKITSDKIICSCLSPFEPYEGFPPFAADATLCLANSHETRQQLIEEGFPEEKIIVFPNYVDDSWLAHPVKSNLPNSPQKIAVVSNHVAPELLHATEILKEKGVAVDIFGIGYTFKLVTPELLYQYDLVITIGKTVQYAIAMKLPVFCYDIHGGPGYIAEESLEKTAYFNFSGRGFSHMTADELAESILSGYKQGVNSTQILRDYLCKNFLLEKNLQNVLRIINETTPIDIHQLYTRYHNIGRYNQSLMRLFALNQDLLYDIEAYRAQQNAHQEYTALLLADIEAYRAVQSNLIQTRDSLANQLNTIQSSRIWRIRTFCQKLLNKLKRN